MKKLFIFLMVLFNVATLLFLLSLISPRLFSSIFYASSKLGDVSLAFPEYVIGWHPVFLIWMLLITFLISTLSSFTTIYFDYREKLSLKKLPFKVFLTLFLIGIGLFLLSKLTEGGSGYHAIPISWIVLSILIPIFYILLQTIFTLFGIKQLKLNRGILVNIILFVVSVLFLSFFTFISANCGYSNSSKDQCNFYIAEVFKAKDVCEKIVDAGTYEKCVPTAQGKDFYKVYGDNQLSLTEGIGKCQRMPFDDPNLITVGRNTKKEECYLKLVFSEPQNIHVLYDRDVRPYALTSNDFPCTYEPVRNMQEEQDLITCLLVFSTQKNSPEEYLESCQNLQRVQKNQCINANPSEKVEASVFFIKSGTEEMVAIPRILFRESESEWNMVLITLRTLLDGPTDIESREYFSVIPKGVKIQSFKIENKTAYVDFSEELERGIAGSMQVLTIREQIEKTLKQFDSIEEVIIGINGRTEDILQP